MAEYKINYRTIVYNLLPHFLRDNKMVYWLYALIKPLSTLNDNAIQVISFGQKNTSLFRFVSFMQDWIKYNGQIRTLEYYLNNIWTTATWPYTQSNNGIYILYAGYSKNYIFNRVESIVQQYYYNNWKKINGYQINELVLFRNKIYKCIAISTNNQPDTSILNWEVYDDANYIYNNGETAVSFIIYVPVGLTGWNEYKFKAQVNQYSLAGKTYQIIYY